MKLCFSLWDVYLGVICLFPIATTLKDGIGLNKVMFVLLLVLQLCMLFSRPIKKRTVLLLGLLAVHYIFVLYSTEFPLQNYNLLAYFPFFLMYTYFVCDNRQRILRWFTEHRRFVSGVIWVWCSLVAVSALLPGCYQVREGGKLYFGSFCKDIFRLGPSAVFIQVLILLSIGLHGRRKNLAAMAVPLYCGLMGSSRTYLVMVFMLFLIGWYLVWGKKRFWKTMLPLGLVMLLLVAVSAVGEKISYTLDDSQYGDFWFRITSSRSYLWRQYLSAWAEQPLLHKLLGCDLEFTRKTAGRWAHNDFLELLCSFGVVGLLHYLYAVRLMWKHCRAGARIPWIVRLCAGLVWLFNACFNMHYVYFCAMLGYPLLLFGLREFYGKGNKEKDPVHHQHRSALPGEILQRTDKTLSLDGCLRAPRP